jgi:hypothetical protein
MTLEELWDKWNFCGCGCPEVACEFLRDALRLIKQRSDENSGGLAAENMERYKANWDKIAAFLGEKDRPGMYWLFLYWLDAQGLIEHGGNVGGGWLTEHGREVLAILEQGCDPADWPTPCTPGASPATTAADRSRG